MSSTDIITLIVTIVCLVSFSAVFTILFHHYYKTNTEEVLSGKEDIELIDNAIDEEKEKRNKTKKTFKLVGKIASRVLLGAIFVIFLFAIVAKIRDNSMPFGDSTAIVIASGSMSQKNNDYVKNNDDLNNQFDTYDIIGLSRYHSQEDVKLYDVVAYKNKKNVTIVHRIVEIKTDSEGNVTYLTQGDSNTSADNVGGSQYSGYLTYDKIIGYYNGTRLKGIGIFVIFLQSPAGIVTVLSIVYCLFMFDTLSSKYKRAIEERTNMLIGLIDYDLSEGTEKNLTGNFSETLFYKGNAYTFQDGKFVSKEELNENEKLTDHMVFVKSQDGKNTVTVTDTRDNSSKVYNDVEEDKLLDPTGFVETDKKEGE